jgi:Protein of unknown function (DUF2934)
MEQIDLIEVRRRAYLFWEERGCPDGSPDEDWFRAEKYVRDDLARRDEPGAQIPVDSELRADRSAHRKPTKRAGQGAVARAAS